MWLEQIKKYVKQIPGLHADQRADLLALIDAAPQGDPFTFLDAVVSTMRTMRVGRGELEDWLLKVWGQWRDEVGAEGIRQATPEATAALEKILEGR